MLIELSDGNLRKNIIEVNMRSIMLRVGSVDDMSGIWIIQIS